MTATDVLRAARAVLSDPRNWIQDDFASNGGWCLMGAIEHVAFRSAARTKAAQIVARLIGDGAPGHESCVISGWNDLPGRVHADVLALLDRAIAHAPR